MLVSDSAAQASTCEQGARRFHSAAPSALPRSESLGWQSTARRERTVPTYIIARHRQQHEQALVVRQPELEADVDPAVASKEAALGLLRPRRAVSHV